MQPSDNNNNVNCFFGWNPNIPFMKFLNTCLQKPKKKLDLEGRRSGGLLERNPFINKIKEVNKSLIVFGSTYYHLHQHLQSLPKSQ